MLTIQNLSKTYSNGTQALSNVNLEIGKGMFGLLGPNGAGKSTLMRIIATLQEPDNGTINLGVLDALKEKHEIRKRLGYLPQEFGVYPNLSAGKLLEHFAVLKGISDSNARSKAVDELLTLTNLMTAKNEPLGNFSGGMKQRFGIAQALLGNPELIIVDEPTAGLDPEERIRFYNLLSLISERVVLVLSTHIVRDVTVLCSNMAILNKGRVCLRGVPQELIQRVEGKIWSKSIPNTRLAEWQNDDRVIATPLTSGERFIRLYSETNPGDDFSLVDPDLEDVYFSVMKGHLKDGGSQ